MVYTISCYLYGAMKIQNNMKYRGSLAQAHRNIGVLITNMPPKKKGQDQANKKTVNKQKEKIIEVFYEVHLESKSSA